jgi:hypothetical protein
MIYSKPDTGSVCYSDDLFFIPWEDVPTLSKNMDISGDFLELLLLIKIKPWISAAFYYLPFFDGVLLVRIDKTLIWAFRLWKIRSLL